MQIPPTIDEQLFQVFKELNAVILYMHLYLDPFVMLQSTYLQLSANEEEICKNYNHGNNGEDDEFSSSGSGDFG